MPINHLVLNGIIRKDLVLSLLLPFLILDNSIAIRYMKTLIPEEQWPSGGCVLQKVISLL